MAKRKIGKIIKKGGLKNKEMKKQEKPKFNLENQIKFFVTLMICVILIVFFIYWISIQTRSFNYAGVEFEKGKQGNLILYKANLPLFDYSGKITNYLSVYFREDPRKLRNINISGTIMLRRNVALAADESFVRNYEDSILAATTLSVYLKALGANPFPATMNKTEAEELNRTYVSCDDTKNYSIIIFQKGNESKIEQKGDCYFLNVKDTEVMNVTEKFMIGAYAHSRGASI